MHLACLRYKHTRHSVGDCCLLPIDFDSNPYTYTRSLMHVDYDDNDGDTSSTLLCTSCRNLDHPWQPVLRFHSPVAAPLSATLVATASCT